MIKAVIFDLDDTLFPETDYVKSGFRAIGKEFNDTNISDKLWQLFKIDKNNVYQRAGFSTEQCEKCIEIYRSHKPDIKLDKDTTKILLQLKKQGIKLGIVTDGRPVGQWNKIYALGLNKIMDKIIVTDELGGETFRKPNPKAFELMREFLGIEFSEMIYVGDNPRKDFFIGSIYPIKTIQIQTNITYTLPSYYNKIFPTYKTYSLSQLLNILAEWS